MLSCKDVILWRLAAITAKALFDATSVTAARRQHCSALVSSMFYFTARVKLART